MQITPSERFNYKPCSIVALYYAYKDIYKLNMSMDHVKTRPDGYLALSKMNSYINMLFHVKKAIQYSKDKRFTLAEFLLNNDKKAIVCVLGHYIYVDGKNYFSFFDNLSDKVVKIWYVEAIKDE